MDKEAKFNKEMEDLYHVVGKATGYWANYYLRSVRKLGGLAHAKKALSKKDTAQDGFNKLIEVGRPDLSIEASVIKGEYKKLFTPEEIEEAKRRLSTVPDYAWRKEVKPDENFSGEINDKEIFKEGATKQVTVNFYERNQAAREECLKKHGYNCKVCGMSFLKAYGEIGRNFIHVHHIKPLAGISGEYELNPKKDLVPVCPNCHAMLHTLSPPLSIDELHKILHENKG
jgi:5-methylcytosine-specific restriction protein A